MRELESGELKAVSGGRRMEQLDEEMRPMQIDPGDGGGSGGGVTDLPPIIVTPPGGGDWGIPGGGGDGGAPPSSGGGGGGGGGGPNPGGPTDPNEDPVGTHTHVIDGLGTISANPIFDNQAHVTGGRFGLSSYGNNGAVSFQEGSVTLMDSYHMENGATISGNLSYLNGTYTETVSGSDQFADLNVSASFNNANYGLVDLKYQASAGVSLNLQVDTNTLVKGGGSFTLYDSGEWKVQARTDVGSGSWGPTDQASIMVTHSGPETQYFQFAVGRNDARGIYLEGGINIPID